jgi:PAS domain S-box-containing protein
MTSEQGIEDEAPPDASAAHFRAMLDAVGDGALRVDAEGRVVFVSDSFVSLTGTDREEVLGSHVGELLVGGDVEGVVIAVEKGLMAGDELWTFVDVLGPEETIPCELRLTRTSVEGERQTLVVVREQGDRQDVSGKTEQTLALERRVRQQRAVADLGQRALENPLLDELFQEAATVVAEHLDATYCKVMELDADRDDLLLRAGVGWNEGTVGQASVPADEHSQAGYTLETDEPVIVNDLSAEGRFSGPDLLTDHGVVSGISTVIGSPESPWGVLGVHDTEYRDFAVHDVNFVRSVAHILATAIDRTAFERKLQQYRAIVETVDDGVYVLDDESRFVMVNEAHERLTGYSREELVGSHASMVTSDDNVERANEEQAHLVASDDRDVVTIETTLERADGETIPVETRFSLFELGDGSFGRVGVVRDVTERKARERQLRRQGERLAALNNLNGVVRNITEELVAGSSRDEIVQAVCDRLADTESYEFAWFGEVGADQEVHVIAEAGVEGYLDDLTLSIATDHPSASGPTVRAFRTQEMQVVQDVNLDPGYERYRAHAEEYGYRSSAAIPVTHEGTLYGVLNVYAARPDGFAGEEREVVGHLGDLIGHAITAVERKQALVSDEVVELVFEIQNLSETLEAEPMGSGHVVYERVIGTGDGSYLVYGSATEDATAFLEEICEEVPHWDDVEILSKSDGRVRFELTLTDPPAISIVARRDGRVAHARLEGDRYQMTVHLPPSADVRQVIDELTDEYPDGDIVVQRQMTRSDANVYRLAEIFERELTQRQRNILETAYYGGFFNWPKDASGTDLAESLGISSPTFHQHLRAAERKLLAGMFETPNGREES